MARKITGKQRREYQAVLQRSAAAVDGLPTPVARKVAPILAQARAELLKDLKKWLDKEDGDKRFTTQKLRSALQQVRSALNTLKETEPALVEGLNLSAKDAASLSMKNVEDEMLRFGHLFDGEMNSVAMDEAIVLARGDSLVLKRFPRSARRYSGDIRKRLVQELAVGRVKGETIRETGERLKRNMPGVFGQFSRRASMVARTEVMHAYNVYHKEGIREIAKVDPGIKNRWDAAYDWRRCPQCKSLDGQVRAVDEEFVGKWRGAKKSYTSRHIEPPAHPNCRCVIVAWHEDWKMDAEGAPPESGDRGKPHPGNLLPKAPRIKPDLDKPPHKRSGANFGKVWLPGEDKAARKARMTKERIRKYRAKKKGLLIPDDTIHPHATDKEQVAAPPKPPPKKKREWVAGAPFDGQVVWDVKTGERRTTKRLTEDDGRIWIVVRDKTRQVGKYPGDNKLQVELFWDRHTKTKPDKLKPIPFHANAPKKGSFVWSKKTGKKWEILHQYSDAKKQNPIFQALRVDGGATTRFYEGDAPDDIRTFWSLFSRTPKKWAKGAPTNGMTVWGRRYGSKFTVVRETDADGRLWFFAKNERGGESQKYRGSAAHAVLMFWKGYSKEKTEKKPEKEETEWDANAPEDGSTVWVRDTGKKLVVKRAKVYGGKWLVVSGGPSQAERLRGDTKSGVAMFWSHYSKSEVKPPPKPVGGKPLASAPKKNQIVWNKITGSKYVVRHSFSDAEEQFPVFAVEPIDGGVRVYGSWLATDKLDVKSFWKTYNPIEPATDSFHSTAPTDGQSVWGQRFAREYVVTRGWDDEEKKKGPWFVLRPADGAKAVSVRWRGDDIAALSRFWSTYLPFKHTPTKLYPEAVDSVPGVPDSGLMVQRKGTKKRRRVDHDYDREGGRPLFSLIGERGKRVRTYDATSSLDVAAFWSEYEHADKEHEKPVKFRSRVPADGITVWRKLTGAEFTVHRAWVDDSKQKPQFWVTDATTGMAVLLYDGTSKKDIDSFWRRHTKVKPKKEEPEPDTSVVEAKVFPKGTSFGKVWLPGESKSERKARLTRERIRGYRLKKKGKPAPEITIHPDATKEQNDKVPGKPAGKKMKRPVDLDTPAKRKKEMVKVSSDFKKLFDRLYAELKPLDKELDKIRYKKRWRWKDQARKKILESDIADLNKIAESPKNRKLLKEARQKMKDVAAAMTPKERAESVALVASRATNTRAGFESGDWTLVRQSIDDVLDLDGLHKRPQDVDDIMIQKNPRGALGTHAWNGRIHIRDTQIKKAKKFTKQFAKPALAKKSRADLKAFGKLSVRARVDIDAHRAAVKERTGWHRNQTKLLDAFKNHPNFTEAEDKKRRAVFSREYHRKGEETLKLLKKMTASLDKIKEHPGKELYDNSQGMRTIVHEAVHGHGNMGTKAYRGHGKIVEEVVTEVSARDIMHRYYGVARSMQRNGGSYGTWIDTLTDGIAASHDVSRDDAFEILTRVSRDMKKSTDRHDGADAFTDAFIVLFPKDKRKAMRDALASAKKKSRP